MISISRTPEEISADIRARLAVTDPSLSAEIGTPERKLIDVVSEVVSESYIDGYLVSTLWDIDTKVGIELEQLVGLFGFGRLAGCRATGQVMFSLNNPATALVYLSSGSQVYVPQADTYPQIVFTIVTNGSISIGDTQVTVSAECSVLGTIGNVTSNSIVGFQSAIGMGAVTNPAPFTGGVDPETDDQLRTRFKGTFLRNVAGVSDFYTALCLKSNYISKVRVMGPIERYSEQLQIASGAATSTNLFSKYTWLDGEFVSTDLGMDEEAYYTKGVDYSFSLTTPPVITIVNQSAGHLPDGTVLDVEHEYTSTNSRNDPDNAITNRVDIFVNGSDAIDTTESTVLSSVIFSATSTSPYYTGNFIRLDGTHPTSGRRFQQLGSVPVVTFPSSFVIGSNTYYDGTDGHTNNYNLVRGTTVLRGSTREICGIEWVTGVPATGTAAGFDYTYNRLPELLDAIVNQNKQITTDTLVHEARYFRGYINLVVVYSIGASPIQVDSSISTALSNWASSLDYGSWIRFSDIESVANSVSGVDSVRFATSGDNGTNYGVQEVTLSGTVLRTLASDLKLNDDELVSFYNLRTIRRSFNTFGG